MWQMLSSFAPERMIGRCQLRAVDRTVAADLHLVADDHVAEVRNLLRPSARAHGITEPVTADAGVRMHLAVAPDFTAGAHEHVRVQRRSSTDAHVVLDDDMGTDAAAVADGGVGADHAVGTQQHVGPYRGCRVHDGRRMTHAPLRESLALAVEVLEQHRHAHRHGRHREAAADRWLVRGELTGDVTLDDEDRGAALPDGLELRRIGDEDETPGTGVGRDVAARRLGFEVALQVGADVGMPGLDGVGLEHGTSLASQEA